MKSPSIDLLNFQRENGQDIEPSATAFVLNSPANAARGREADTLFSYLVLTGNAIDVNLSDLELQKIISDAFFGFTGPLTSALKNTIEKINSMLMDANLRSTSKGAYRFGCMVICAIQQQRMTIVQAGPSRVYQLGSTVREFFDASLAGKGLGISPTPKMFFAQAMLSGNDAFVITLEQPIEWKMIIEGMNTPQTPARIKTQLLDGTSQDVAGLVLSLSENLVSQPVNETVNIPIEPVNTREVSIKSPPVSRSDENHNDQPIGVIDKPASRRRQRSSNNVEISSIAGSLLSAVRNTRTFFSDLGDKFEGNLIHLLPESRADISGRSISQTVGKVTAVLLPVFVLILAQLVYSNIGFDARYKEYVDLAKSQISQAMSESDPSVKRSGLNAGLDWLKKAEQSSGQLDADTKSIQQQTLLSLDEINKVQRLDFVPSLTQPLPAGLLPQKMVASNTDLFFMEASGNQVLRYIYNGNTFDQDAGFKCSIGEHTDTDGQLLSIGRLIDIAPLPQASNNPAILLAIDENAHLMFCSPSGEPKVAALVIPDLGIKQVGAVALYDHTLFVLDKVGKGIYIYYGNSEWDFADAPGFAFSEQIPNGLENANELIVGNDTISILFADGHITNCGFDHTTGVTNSCEDPKTLIDTRPISGSDPSALSNLSFGQIVITQQPNSSVLMLEPSSRSVFIFSPGYFELQKQLMSSGSANDPVPANKQASLMAVSPGKVLHLLIDNQVYSAVLK